MSWLLRVNHQKGLLVQQQLLCCVGHNNGQHCQIAGNSCGNSTRELLFVRWEQSGHNYRLGTERSVLKHQGETRGYGKKVMNRDNPQPSPKLCDKHNMDAVQRLNVSGPPLAALDRVHPHRDVVYKRNFKRLLLRLRGEFVGSLPLAMAECVLAYSN